MKAPGRILGLFCFGATIMGCVIPVAPEFEDPEDNYPPYIVGAMPSEGTEYTPPLNGRAEFTVFVRDPNPGDTLYVRWTIDYPNYNENSRYAREDVLPNTSDPRGTMVKFSPNCVDHSIARTLKMHRVTMSLADREFVSSDANPPTDSLFDTVPAGAFRQRATWLLILECKAP